MAHCEIFNTGQKASFPHNGQGQCAKHPSRGINSFFVGTVLARDMPSCIFSIDVTLLSFCLMLESCFVNFLVHIFGWNLRIALGNPWIGCLLIHTWCNLLSTTQGFFSRPEDCYAKLKPEICNWKSVDNRNLNFVHDIRTIKHFCCLKQLPTDRRSLTTCTWESHLHVLLRKLNFPLPCSYIHFVIYMCRCLCAIKLFQHKWD